MISFDRDGTEKLARSGHCGQIKVSLYQVLGMLVKVSLDPHKVVLTATLTNCLADLYGTHF